MSNADPTRSPANSSATINLPMNGTGNAPATPNSSPARRHALPNSLTSASAADRPTPRRRLPTVRRLLTAPQLPTALAVLLLLTAILLPPFNITRPTYDYLVVFDISQSMNVEDYTLGGAPVSRLAYARETVRRALHELPCGSRIGWAVFAEYRTLVLLAPIEVCNNYNDLLASLDRIDGRMRWGNASEISKGVFWAMRGARDVGGHPNVLFLTDGQEAPPVDGEGLALFDDLKRGDIKGWLIGVGSYTPQPIPRTDPDGRPIGFWRSDEVVQRNTTRASHEHLSEVREPYLKKLANQIGFEYLHLNGADSIRVALLHVPFAEKRRAPADFAWLAAVAALLTLLIGCARVQPQRLSYRIRAGPRK